MSTLEQMVSARTQKSVFVVGLLLCASVIIALFPSGVRADHFDAANPNPCQEVVGFTEEPVPSGAGIAGSRRGEVPVYDDDTQENLSRMIRLLSQMSQFSQSAELETRRSSNYLRLLCEKEYNLDHTLQHAWTLVIDQFVIETINWVQTVYNNNPIFVTNQSIYYKLVDKNVFSTLVQEVAVSQIGPNNKRDVLKYLFTNRFVDVFPYPLARDIGVETLAPDELPDDLQRFYTEEEWNRLTRAEGNVVGVINIAQRELDRRIQETRTNETNKLNWGRGFFSYEICDLQIFGYIIDTESTTNFETIPQDRRNCRVVTPGSLIQDQTSFVLGSALRQMELADEVDEWVSANAALALRNILGNYGLNFGGTASAGIGGSDPFVYGEPATPSALSPSELEAYVDAGVERATILVDQKVGEPLLQGQPSPYGITSGYPAEFQVGQEILGGLNALSERADALRAVNARFAEQGIEAIPDLGN